MEVGRQLYAPAALLLVKEAILTHRIGGWRDLVGGLDIMGKSFLGRVLTVLVIFTFACVK
jgi:hypothetical protein